MSTLAGTAPPLRIAFDTWPLGSRFRNMGIYVYARTLLSCFREMAAQHSVEVKPFISEKVANDAGALTAAEGFVPQRSRLLTLDRAWRFGGASLTAFFSKADLLFCPSGNTLPLKPLLPAVSTIHDVTPVVCPSYPGRIARMLRFSFGNSARLSRAVITDSECSKADLIRVYGLPESKVHVVYLGYDTRLFNQHPVDRNQLGALLNRIGITRPYILHHGTIQPRKNLRRLAAAYKRVLSRNLNLDVDLVLVGQFGWQYEDVLDEVRSVRGREAILVPGPLSDPELAMLLKGAHLVVIPSLYEGFCLPMVESMACGAATICSNASCLPEISGGVLKYFDPCSVEEMADCIEQVLESDELRQELCRRGQARASQFGWERCALETLGILKAAALT